VGEGCVCDCPAADFSADGLDVRIVWYDERGWGSEDGRRRRGRITGDLKNEEGRIRGLLRQGWNRRTDLI
jgi:hypothetical protein